MIPGPLIKVADEVWIATALLHQEFPERRDFSTREIILRLRQESAAPQFRSGVRPHISHHCVANRPPNPGRYRMLFATGKGRRRLFRNGDPYDPDRAGSKTVPAREEIPAHYHALLDWYAMIYCTGDKCGRIEQDPILALRGLGRTIWNEQADQYVEYQFKPNFKLIGPRLGPLVQKLKKILVPN